MGLQRLLQLQVSTALLYISLYFYSRVEFNYQETAWWWNNEDFIYLTFDEPVSFVTVAHPIKDVVLYSTSPAGQQTYKLDFKPDFNPGDNRIDFNIRKLTLIIAFQALKFSL